MEAVGDPVVAGDVAKTGVGGVGAPVDRDVHREIVGGGVDKPHLPEVERIKAGEGRRAWRAGCDRSVREARGRSVRPARSAGAGIDGTTHFRGRERNDWLLPDINLLVHIAGIDRAAHFRGRQRDDRLLTNVNIIRLILHII